MKQDQSGPLEKNRSMEHDDSRRKERERGDGEVFDCFQVMYNNDFFAELCEMYIEDLFVCKILQLDENITVFM